MYATTEHVRTFLLPRPQSHKSIWLDFITWRTHECGWNVATKLRPLDYAAVQIAILSLDSTRLCNKRSIRVDRLLNSTSCQGNFQWRYFNELKGRQRYSKYRGSKENLKSRLKRGSCVGLEEGPLVAKTKLRVNFATKFVCGGNITKFRILDRTVLKLF